MVLYMRIELDPRMLRDQALVLRRTASDLAITVDEIEAALTLIGQSSTSARALGDVVDMMQARALDFESRADFAETYQPIEDIDQGDACDVEATDKPSLFGAIAQGLANYGAGRANGFALFAGEVVNKTAVPFALQQLGLMDPLDLEVPAPFPDADHANLIHGIGTAEGYLGLTALEIVVSPNPFNAGSRWRSISIGAEAAFEGADAVIELADRLLPIDGYHDVVITCSAAAATARGDVPPIVDHRVLSRLIADSDAYPGGPIRLITEIPSAGFAQDLANKLGVEVLAPIGTSTPAEGEFTPFSPAGRTPAA